MTQAHSQYDLIPAGTYTARALATSFGTTKNGNEELTVRLAVTGGDYEGRHVWARLYFTEKTTPRSLESLGHMGFAADFLELCEPVNDASALLPTECRVVIEHDTYNGKVSAKVAWINSLYGQGGGAMKQAPGSALDAPGKRAFAARMRAASGTPAPVRSIGGGAGAKALEAPPSHADDSDIPF
jgi:hypothetical protein